MNEVLTDVEQREALVKDFKQKLYKLHDKQRAISKWHIALFAWTNGEIGLPYNPTDTWEWITVGKYEHVDRPTEDNPENQEYEYVVDTDASLRKLSKIAKFATGSSLVDGIEKKYTDDEFKLIITLNDEGAKVTYSVKREVVCTKRVIGTKVIPARPEETVDEVEWDCKPVSLLGFDATAE